MDLRALIRNLQEGVKSKNDEDLIPHDSLLRVNTANELITYLNATHSTPRLPIIAECAKRSYPYSHIKNSHIYEESVSRIISGCPIIVISHQPTFFPYSGVYVQFILADYIVKEMKNRYGVDSVIVYLCLDTDDACDRRIRTAHFPFPGTKEGYFPISYKMDGDYRNVPQFCVPFHDKDYRSVWKNSIIGRYNLLLSLVPNLKDELRVTQKNTLNYLDLLFDETISLRPSIFSDFSLSIFMSFLKDIVDTPVIPIHFSDLFTLGINSILPIFDLWNDISITGKELLEKFDIEKNTIFNMGPAWLICNECHFRNSASYKEVIDAFSSKKIHNKCLKCGISLTELDKDFIIMPKVIIEDLSAILLTGANITLTYAGSTQHVVLSNLISKKVFQKQPSIYTWHPKQFLGGVLERAAFDLINKNCKAESSKQFLRLASEGRDTLLYLTQITNFKELSDNWYRHINNNRLCDQMIFNENYTLFNSIETVNK